MSQGYVKFSAPKRPLRGLHLLTSNASWEVCVASVLRWSDGTVENITRGTKILPQSGTIDMTSDYWLVVWKQGAPTLPVAIKLKDYGSLDSLVGGTWAVSHWLTDDAQIWQQA